MRGLRLVVLIAATATVLGACGSQGNTAQTHAASLSGKATIPTTTATPSTSDAPPTVTLPTTTVPSTPHTGTTQTVTDDVGAQYSVTLTKIIDPATGALLSIPDPGTRFIATVFTLTDTGTYALHDDAYGDVTLVGSDGQDYRVGITTNVSDCTNFSGGQFRLGIAESVSGCVAFQLPTGVTAARVQWTPSLGGASDTAEWLNP